MQSEMWSKMSMLSFGSISWFSLPVTSVGKNNTVYEPNLFQIEFIGHLISIRQHPRFLDTEKMMCFLLSQSSVEDKCK